MIGAQALVRFAWWARSLDFDEDLFGLLIPADTDHFLLWLIGNLVVWFAVLVLAVYLLG